MVRNIGFISLDKDYGKTDKFLNIENLEDIACSDIAAIYGSRYLHVFIVIMYFRFLCEYNLID